MSCNDPDDVVIVYRKDRELKKKVLVRGDYDLVPYEGSKCKVKITEIVFCNENGECEIYEESRYFNPGFDGSVVVGEADSFVDMDFDQSLRTMCCGEICILTMSYSNIEGRLMKKISCKVEVVDVSIVDLISDWPWEKLFETSKRHKDRGVELIKEKRIVDAFRQFGKAIKFLIAIEPIDPDAVPSQVIEEMIDVRVKLYNNLAHCQLHFKEYEAALYLCNKALEYDKNNVKSLYRRCMAYSGLQMFEEAYTDIQRVLHSDPNDKNAQQKANMLKPKIKKINENYTAVIKKMFV